MNILLLTSAVPFPPDRGPRIKTYHLIRHLAGRHRVTLVSIARDEAEEQAAAALAELCDTVYTVRVPRTAAAKLLALGRSLLSGRPYAIERSASPALAGLVADLIAAAAAAGRPFDLVHADQLMVAQFALPLGMPRLLDTHNALWRVFDAMAAAERWPRRWLWRREAALLRAYEAQLIAAFDAVATVSEEDRQSLLELLPAPREISIIPIGIDADQLRPAARAGESHRILSLANPDWAPNAEGLSWFVRHVYPLVSRAVPTSQVHICGPSPRPELRDLAERRPNVFLSGQVDPQPYLDQAGCLIAPLRSPGGMRVAILEALARGVPVVATSLACADLDVIPGRHLLVADTPSGFADAVSTVLRDQDLAARLAQAGRQFALDRYDWRMVYPAIDGLYARLAGQAAAPAGEPAAVQRPVASS